MSHFTVLTIVPASKVADRPNLEDVIAEMMAPYSEELEWDLYKEHVDNEYVEAMAKHYEIDATNLSALADKMTDWHGGTGGVDEQGLYRLSTWNKDSTWDWYQIGGRWAGRMLGKITAKSGDIVWGDRFSLNPLVSLEQEDNPRLGFDDNGVPTHLRCDGGRKRALALDEMRGRAEYATHRDFDRYQGIIDQYGPLPPSPREVDFTGMSAELRQGIIDTYWQHPTIVALNSANLYTFLVRDSEGAFDRDTEVQRARASAVPGYAMLTDKGWVAPGKMGWWGMSSDKPEDKDNYLKAANAIIDAAADDDILVMLDAHV